VVVGTTVFSSVNASIKKCQYFFKLNLEPKEFLAVTVASVIS